MLIPSTLSKRFCQLDGNLPSFLVVIPADLDPPLLPPLLEVPPMDMKPPAGGVVPQASRELLFMSIQVHGWLFLLVTPFSFSACYPFSPWPSRSMSSTTSINPLQEELNCTPSDWPGKDVLASRRNETEYSALTLRSVAVCLSDSVLSASASTFARAWYDY